MLEAEVAGTKLLNINLCDQMVKVEVKPQSSEQYSR